MNEKRFAHILNNTLTSFELDDISYNQEQHQYIIFKVDYLISIFHKFKNVI